MAASILSILAYLVPFILEAIKNSAPARAQEARDAEIQKGRVDIAGVDPGPVAARIDRLLMVQAGGASGGAGGVGAGAPEGGDDVTLKRLAALGIGPG
jgi:hypothetical protein